MDISGMSHYYIVWVSCENEENHVFDLTIKKNLYAIPIRKKDELSFSVKRLNFWNVKLISFNDLEKCSKNIDSREYSINSSKADTHLVVSLGNYKREGKFFSAFTGRIFKECDSWDSLLPFIDTSGFHTITVITDITHLPYSLFSNILEKEIQTAEYSLPGFITGYTRTDVRWSLLKSLIIKDYQSSNDLFLFGCPKTTNPRLFSGVETIWWEDLHVSAIQNLSKKNFFLAALVSHSNGVDGNFAEGILCPRSSVNSDLPILNNDGNEGIPSCVYSELCQRDPLEKHYRFHPDSISAAIVFYDTCAGFLTKGAFALPSASLGLSFLTGSPAAFITSIRKKATNTNLTLLFRALLYDGVSLGRITRVLNQYQYSEFGELPSMFLFGDPAFHLDKKTIVPNEFSETSEGSIMIDKWDTHSLHLQLGDKFSLLIPDEQNKDVLCIDISGKDKKQKEWWVVRQNPLLNSIKLMNPEIHHLIHTFHQLLYYYYKHYQFLKILYQGFLSYNSKTIVEPLNEIINTAMYILPLFNNISDFLHGKSWSYNRYHEIVNHIEQVLASVNSLNKLLPPAYKATKQWAVLHHFYAQCLGPAEDEKPAHRNCPVCGSWMVERISEYLWDKELKRIMYTCIRCGVIADIPPFVDIPNINGPDTCTPGKSINQELMCKSSLSGMFGVEITGYFGGFGSEVVKCRIDPDTLSVNLRNDKKIKGEITLNFSKDCPPGLYSLVIVASSLLTPIIAAKYIRVVLKGRNING